jgi:hypothetical protein
MRNPALTPEAGHPGLERGVYREPVHSGGRPVLIAVTSDGERIATRTLWGKDDVRTAVRELTALLDYFDPWPKIRLVRDAADIAAPVGPADQPKRLTAEQLDRIYPDADLARRALRARTRSIRKAGRRGARHN